MATIIASIALGVWALTLCPGASATTDKETRAERAERFLRVVYCCEPADLAAMSAPDVCISYPIFEEVLGKVAIRGQADVRAFSSRFCSRWSEPKLVVHETLSEGGGVFLLWSFQAVSSAGGDPEVRRWGGMSYVQFDAEGRVVLELGEESTPGPWARIHASGDE